jgi:hypothetical protein
MHPRKNKGTVAKTSTTPTITPPANLPRQKSRGSHAEGSRSRQEAQNSGETMPPTTNAPRQPGSSSQGSHHPQQAENSGEEFDLPISDHDQESEDLQSHSRTQATQATSKSSGAKDIRMLFRVSTALGKRICVLCG